MTTHANPPVTTHASSGDVLHDPSEERSRNAAPGPDQTVAVLAGRQRGLVTRGQLLGAGLGRGAIAHRVAKGRLLAVHRGVFLVGHRAPVPLATELAALLGVGVRALLSHRSAGVVWQLPVPVIGLVELTVVGSRTRPRSGVLVRRVTGLDARDRRMHHGLALTAPARTLLDLGSVLVPRALERAVAEARARRMITLSDLEGALSRAPGRRGAAALRALLRQEGGPALTRSRAEELLLGIVRGQGLPTPELNVRVEGYEVDFLWRNHGLVVEVDGYAFHSSPAAFERDRLKDAVLQDAGLRVRRVTWRQLSEDPGGLGERLRRALASA